MKIKSYNPYRPLHATGQKCTCRKGIERDNCPQCEGTGWRIDFRAILRSFLTRHEEWNQ